MDGSILQKWTNVDIESGYTDNWSGTQTTSNAIKAFGINFVDPATNRVIILGNSVPYIIEYKEKRQAEM